MEFHVYENARAACEAAGVLIAAQITRKGDSVLGLATGSTPIPAYEMLAQWYDRGVMTACAPSIWTSMWASITRIR